MQNRSAEYERVRLDSDEAFAIDELARKECGKRAVDRERVEGAVDPCARPVRIALPLLDADVCRKAVTPAAGRGGVGHCDDEPRE